MAWAVEGRRGRACGLFSGGLFVLGGRSMWPVWALVYCIHGALEFQFSVNFQEHWGRYIVGCYQGLFHGGNLISFGRWKRALEDRVAARECFSSSENGRDLCLRYSGELSRPMM